MKKWSSHYTNLICIHILNMQHSFGPHIFSQDIDKL